MTPAQWDLCAYRNTVFAETYTFGIDGTPLDITGNSFRMQIRGYAGDPGSPLIDLATVGSDDIQGIYVIDPLQGLFSIRIDKATLAALPEIVPAPLASVFTYDLVLIDIDGDDLGPVMQGNFTLYEGVTV